MTDLDKPLTLNDLVKNIRIDARFLRYEWDISNKLVIEIMYDDIRIASETVCIEPAGYVQEEIEPW